MPIQPFLKRAVLLLELTKETKAPNRHACILRSYFDEASRQLEAYQHVSPFCHGVERAARAFGVNNLGKWKQDSVQTRLFQTLTAIDNDPSITVVSESRRFSSPLYGMNTAESTFRDQQAEKPGAASVRDFSLQTASHVSAGNEQEKPTQLSDQRNGDSVTLPLSYWRGPAQSMLTAQEADKMAIESVEPIPLLASSPASSSRDNGSAQSIDGSFTPLGDEHAFASSCFGKPALSMFETLESQKWEVDTEQYFLFSTSSTVPMPADHDPAHPVYETDGVVGTERPSLPSCGKELASSMLYEEKWETTPHPASSTMSRVKTSAQSKDTSKCLVDDGRPVGSCRKGSGLYTSVEQALENSTTGLEQCTSLPTSSTMSTLRVTGSCQSSDLSKGLAKDERLLLSISGEELDASISEEQDLEEAEEGAAHFTASTVSAASDNETEPFEIVEERMEEYRRSFVARFGIVPAPRAFKGCHARRLSSQPPERLVQQMENFITAFGYPTARVLLRSTPDLLCRETSYLLSKLQEVNELHGWSMEMCRGILLKDAQILRRSVYYQKWWRTETAKHLHLTEQEVSDIVLRWSNVLGLKPENLGAKFDALAAVLRVEPEKASLLVLKFPRMLSLKPETIKDKVDAFYATFSFAKVGEAHQILITRPNILNTNLSDLQRKLTILELELGGIFNFDPRSLITASPRIMGLSMALLKRRCAMLASLSRKNAGWAITLASCTPVAAAVHLARADRYMSGTHLPPLPNKRPSIGNHQALWVKPRSQKVTAPQPSHQKLTVPQQPSHQNVTAPQPSHQKVTTTQASDQKVIAPQPSHQKLTKPQQPRHQNVTAPQPRHQNVTAPQPRHQNVTAPQPSHQNVTAPQPRHQNVTAPQPRHQNVTALQPSHQKLTEPQQPRHQNVTAPQPSHQKLTEPQQPRHQKVTAPQPRYQKGNFNSRQGKHSVQMKKQ